jgi:hypothetical protein
VLFNEIYNTEHKAPQTPEEHTAAYRTSTAYTGKWRVDCEKFITKVDVAWNPAWVGTEQARGK